MTDAAEARPRRIHYPHGSWFPLQKEVFVSVFPELTKKRSVDLYLAMYERARHRQPPQPFAANLNDLAKMINCDARTVRPCITELVGQGFVEMSDEGGKLRSRTRKTEFTVPLAEQRLEAGNWFPVPRFFVTDYISRFAGSLVLIALLYHQHMKTWRRDCWPGVERLGEMLNLKKRTVFSYLNQAGHENRWKGLKTGLPWPVKISYSPDGKTRHYSVRAAQIFTPQGRKKPVVRMREEFAVHFGFVEKDAKTGDFHDN